MLYDILKAEFLIFTLRDLETQLLAHKIIASNLLKSNAVTFFNIKYSN